LDGLFDLTNGLIGLAFFAKLVVPRQGASGFLDSALHDICLATHDGNSSIKKADVVEHPKAFHHVGLLVNEPPGTAELPFT
jgi:hypothetical protein